MLIALKVDSTKTDASQKLLVDRVAASRYINKSARLRDLLLYLCDRVFEGLAEEIHEQEIGHKVFGRPPDYDTSSDNIVRVHVSMLRKRLEQYFGSEGAHEPVILEIPRGNYTPVFRERTAFLPDVPARRKVSQGLANRGSHHHRGALRHLHGPSTFSQ